MITIETRAHVGADGTLAVQVPTTLREEDVEVLLVLQRPSQRTDATDDLGYSPHFFEETFGSFRDDPLERLPQEESEEREPLQ
ncbi:MAG: hypothetical protein M3Y28_03090 [Armatimonadota bacterium]|nr:hypothetical protein [Armatimonadota bacterium]